MLTQKATESLRASGI